MELTRRFKLLNPAYHLERAVWIQASQGFLPAMWQVCLC